MFRKLFPYLIGLSLLYSCRGEKQVTSTSQPISHSLWDSLLQQHVQADGLVDYKGFLKDSTTLNQYLATLETHHPNNKNWTKNQQLAYWINAYNAYTIQLVIRHYPVESIRDIGPTLEIPMVRTVWHIDFIEIEGVSYNLDYIEHGILREEFEEPRIHFAINCASISCPDLRAEAYTANQLERQLEEQAISFLNDTNKNTLSKNQIKISKIFKWFKGDFTKKSDLITYLNQFLEVKVNGDAEVDYLDYNWQLNDIE